MTSEESRGLREFFCLHNDGSNKFAMDTYHKTRKDAENRQIDGDEIILFREVSPALDQAIQNMRDQFELLIEDFEVLCKHKGIDPSLVATLDKRKQSIAEYDRARGGV